MNGISILTFLVPFCPVEDARKCGFLWVVGRPGGLGGLLKVRHRSFPPGLIRSKTCWFVRMQMIIVFANCPTAIRFASEMCTPLAPHSYSIVTINLWKAHCPVHTASVDIYVRRRASLRRPNATAPPPFILIFVHGHDITAVIIIAHSNRTAIKIRGEEIILRAIYSLLVHNYDPPDPPEKKLF
jgi:hypothetical protein